MPISPMYVGQRMNPLGIKLTVDGGAPQPLTGADFTLLITSQTDPTNQVTGQGSFSISDAEQGLIVYYPATADTAVAGVYTWQIMVTYPEGPCFFDPVPVIIRARGAANLLATSS